MAVKSIQPRKQPAQPRAQVTVASILEAMELLLIEKGYVSASTNRIAERAGISIGTLYHYFPNREAIALALYEHTCSKSALRMKQIMVAVIDLPLETAIPQVIAEILDIHQRHKVIFLQLVDEVPELRELSATLSFNTLLRGSIRVFLEQHSLTITLENIERSGFFVENIIMGNIRRYVRETPAHTDRRAFIAELSTAVCAYITGPRMTGE